MAAYASVLDTKDEDYFDGLSEDEPEDARIYGLGDVTEDNRIYGLDRFGSAPPSQFHAYHGHDAYRATVAPAALQYQQLHASMQPAPPGLANHSSPTSTMSCEGLTNASSHSGSSSFDFRNDQDEFMNSFVDFGDADGDPFGGEPRSATLVKATHQPIIRPHLANNQYDPYFKKHQESQPNPSPRALRDPPVNDQQQDRSPHDSSNQTFNLLAGSTLTTQQALPYPVSSLVPSKFPLILHISPFPKRRRVELQWRVWLTLSQLPPGVKQLHFQPYNLSRAKHLTQKPLGFSPERLELYMEVVRTSVLTTPTKIQQALRRAATSIRDADRPLRGGNGLQPQGSGHSKPVPPEADPIQPCPTCRVREKNRSQRTQNTNNEARGLLYKKWLDLQEHRSCMVNNSELLNWDTPGLPKKIKRDRNKKDGDAQVEDVPDYDSANFPSEARQISFDFRLGCKCCHHGSEKEGFRVIFTIRDHQQTVVAQAISDSILIADDPKNTGNQVPGHVNGLSRAYPMTAPTATAPTTTLPSAGMAPGAVLRNVVSTNDLPSGHSQIYSFSEPRTVYPTGEASDSQFMGPQSFPQYVAHHTAPSQSTQSARSPTFSSGVSRPASPTAITSSQNKRRKHSGSRDAMSNALTMTSLVSTSRQTHSASSTRHPSGRTPPHAGPSYPQPAPGPNEYGASANGSPLIDSPDSLLAQPHLARGKGKAREGSQSHGCIDNLQAVARRNAPGDASCSSSQIGISSSSSSHQSQSDEGLFMANQAAHNVPTPVSPTFEDIAPHQGNTAGGYLVLISGADFQPHHRIFFGENEATVTKFNPHVLSCHVPAVNHHMTVEVTLRGVDGQIVGPMNTPYKRYYFTYVGEMPALSSGALVIPRRPSESQWGAPSFQPGQSPFPAGPPGTNASHGSNVDSGYGYQGSGFYSMTGFTQDELLDKYLNTAHADPDTGLADGQTMLHMAASNGLQKLAARLLSQGADPNIRDDKGMSPLHYAAMNGCVSCVQTLRHFGADPILRDLKGSTPADLSSTWEVRDAISTLRGDFSFFACNPKAPLPAVDMFNPGVATDGNSVLQSGPTVWRDNLIQQLQQTVARAIPPLPNFPPLPQIPDVQEHPMVRRVKQRIVDEIMARAGNVGEAEYRWWELLTGASSPAPPRYEEIYPKASSATHDEKTVVTAAGDATDKHFDTPLDKAESLTAMETVNISGKGATPEQQEQLRATHARKMKKLRSDRKLFFIWIPLLIIVLVAMVRDRAPQVAAGARHSYKYVQSEVLPRLRRQIT